MASIRWVFGFPLDAAGMVEDWNMVLLEADRLVVGLGTEVGNEDVICCCDCDWDWEDCEPIPLTLGFDPD
jgi:hypothetical protein